MDEAFNSLPVAPDRISTAASFAKASRSRFFLCIQSDDPLFDLDDTRTFLESLAPRRIIEVPS